MILDVKWISLEETDSSWCCLIRKCSSRHCRKRQFCKYIYEEIARDLLTDGTGILPVDVN